MLRVAGGQRQLSGCVPLIIFLAEIIGIVSSPLRNPPRTCGPPNVSARLHFQFWGRLKYHLTYQLKAHPEGIEREEIPEGHGGCDAMVMVSIIRADDGALCLKVLSLDGTHAGQISGNELWQAWMVMAAKLAQAPEAELNPFSRLLCTSVLETARKFVAGQR